MCYIGQTKNILERIRVHLSDLRAGRHFNKHLQRAFNKYGEDAFEFRVLEACVAPELNALECYWINACLSDDRHFGYNMRTGGAAGFTVTQEARYNMSQARKGYLNAHPEEKTKWLRRVAESNRGREWTEEQRSNLRKSMQAVVMKPGSKTGLHLADRNKTEKARSAVACSNKARIWTPEQREHQRITARISWEIRKQNARLNAA